MGLLDGKTALIFGVANDHSIAWGMNRETLRLHRDLAQAAAAPVAGCRIGLVPRTGRRPG